MDLEWRFPAVEPHSGIPLGNGTFGALIWGEGREVRITVNRADYWDHRGGLATHPEAGYANLRRWLEEGNEARLREVFEGRGGPNAERPMKPTRLPMGRVDLELPSGLSLGPGDLALDEGAALIDLRGAVAGDAEPVGQLRAVLLREAPVLVLAVRGPAAGQLEVLSRPSEAPDLSERFRQTGTPPAQPFEEDDCSGWTQSVPGEPVMAAAWRKVVASDGPAEGERVTLYVTSVYGPTPEAAVGEARRVLDEAAAGDYETHARDVAGWWRGYWQQCASIELPSPTLTMLYRLGMYKLAGLSVPGSPAATLQGPWVEEYRLPPWSSDYHFNINVQECHWPAYSGNQLGALEPLFAMLRAWEPRLRENARIFAGIDDGLLLPHAVDDRCTGMGGFWTGAVDHGSTAWTAQLMWLYYRHTMDEPFLRDTAYPFLRGALRVYETMLEDDDRRPTTDDRQPSDAGSPGEGSLPVGGRSSVVGRRLRLPVSVSPEFGGAGAHAWGANASFQLAIIHFLCRTVGEASRLLGADAEHRERWEEIDRRLPLGSISGEGGRAELLLWDGQPLTESHRHHSHLAGIYPFDIFDLEGADRALVRNSMRTLTRMGMGRWTGWCVPWAAILHARLGNGQMAELLLETFRRMFMGPGYASTHDAVFPGFTLHDSRPDIMQIEAAMGAAAAVLEMLLHTRGGILHVFPALPGWWEEASFRGIRAEGAFLVSAAWRDGRVEEVRVTSEAGAPLRLANPWGEAAVRVERAGGAETVTGAVLALRTSAGETLVLQPA
jgi:alpha-L-fucosidase 2